MYAVSKPARQAAYECNSMHPSIGARRGEDGIIITADVTNTICRQLHNSRQPAAMGAGPPGRPAAISRFPSQIAKQTRNPKFHAT